MDLRRKMAERRRIPRTTPPIPQSPVTPV